MFFIDKIFFAGLIALPVLVLIYFLHRKLKTVEVSSLILWQNQLNSTKSGTGLKAMPLPLKFFIETLIIILLVLAAAGPFWISEGQVPPLTVILDDSFSMRAGAENSPRAKAEKALLKLITSTPSRPVQLVLAGSTPRMLGKATSESSKIKHLLKKWRCLQASSDISEALLFVRRTFGNKNDILVLTDHKSPLKKLSSGMDWFAFGRAAANTAIINATRSSSPRGDRCLVEVVNYSTNGVALPLKIDFPGAKSRTKPMSFLLNVAAGKKARKVFRLPVGAGTIKISLPEDELNFDNRVVLLPEKNSKIRVKLSKLKPDVRKLLEKVLKLTDKVTYSNIEPQLVFSNAIQKISPANTGKVKKEWQFIIKSKSAEKSKAFVGPYTIDRQHPLTMGLQFDGVIWGGDDSKLPGTPLVFAGNAPLVSEYITGPYRRFIFMKFSPENSTLQDSPNWPVLIYNLLEWRSRALPGLIKNNYRAGEKIQFNAPPETHTLTVSPPDNKEFEIVLNDRQNWTMNLLYSGKYELKTDGGKNYIVMVNPLAADESDLRTCHTQKLRGESTESIYRKRFMNAAWIFMLAALAFSVWHLYLIRRSAL